MDKHHWSVTFQRYPIEDGPLRLVQAVRLIVTSSRHLPSEREGEVLVEDADERREGADVAREEKPV